MAVTRRYIIHANVVEHVKVVSNLAGPMVRVQLRGRRLIDVRITDVFEEQQEAERVCTARELKRLQHIP